MALLKEMFSLYTSNTTGTLACVLVITVVVYFLFFGQRKQSVASKDTKSREIKSVDINTTDEKHVLKSTKKEVAVELEKKQVSNTDKESEASVNVTVKKEPVLAAYDATTAVCLLESRKYIESHFKVSSKISTTSNILIGATAGVAIASRGIQSQYVKIEGLEFGNNPNEFIKQEEDGAEKETVEKDKSLVTKEKEVTPEPIVEEKAKPAIVEVESVQVGEKESVSEPVVEGKEPAVKEKEKTVEEEIVKIEEGVSTVIIEETKKEHVEPVKVPVEPFLAAFNATAAITTLESQQYISSLPKAPKPFLAAYNASEAMVTLKAQEYISTLPKAPRPFLAAYNASEAITTLKAQEYVSTLPKAPRPFLAAYNASEAITTLESQQYIAALPKAPRPFLAAYNASEAITTLEAQQYISKLIKASKPFLADYNASTAITTLEAQQYVAFMVESDKAYAEALSSTLDRLQSQENTTDLSRCSSGDSLALFEATTASNISTSREYITATHKEYLSALKTATSTMQSATAEALLTNEEQEEDEENNGLSLSPSDASSSTSSLHSESMAAAASTSDAKSTSDIINDSNQDQDKSLHINTIDQTNKSTSHFDMSWDQIYSGSGNANKKSQSKVQSPTALQASPVTKTNEPFMSTVQCTYYPNCTNKNCKFIHPGNDNNPRPIPKRASTVDVEYKKPWTRPERIERQSQTHYPTWKSRCVHWPYCTNNHCKYSHPIKECRMGDQCTFMERCMFLHPSDLLEPVKKGSRNNTHPIKRSNTTSD